MHAAVAQAEAPGVPAALREAGLEQLAIRHLADFVQHAWPIIEPSRPLIWTWHIDVVCDHLEAVTRGDTRELVICIPPGLMKSLLVSVFWPTWWWLQDPGHRFLCLSNDDQLVIRDSRRSREIIRSDIYQRLVARSCAGRDEKPWELSKDQAEKVHFANTAQGFRQCLSMGSNVTGKRADTILIDDPYDAKQAVLGNREQVSRRMDEVVTVYDQVLSTRLNDQRTGSKVLIMQRLHQADLAGVLLERKSVQRLLLPMEYDPNHPHVSDDDPRTEPGELLAPEFMPREAVDLLKTSMGSQQSAGQLGQLPSPAEGGILKRGWMQSYKGDPKHVTVEHQAISLDCAFKGGRKSDFVVMQAWGRRGAMRLLLDQVRGRMSFTETKAAFRAFCAKWPKATLKLVEDKANGPAIIDELRKEVDGLVPYNPKDSKEARAQAVAPLFEAGNIWQPEPRWAPWVGDYVEELCAFPAGANDDQVDATTQMLLKWRGADVYFGCG